jgi:hypothetical protein
MIRRRKNKLNGSRNWLTDARSRLVPERHRKTYQIGQRCATVSTDKGDILSRKAIAS